MANERKTEHIVRSHFEKFNDIINIEEQTSDNSKIDKLLKSASKKASGKGRPEFLISFSGNSDLLIVIECKANNTKHESSSKDKYAEFAVDGALLYSSYLSKDFDVLAIAVSGETKQQLKVSHFLQLKGERKPVSIFGDKLLSANDYLDGYLRSPEKFRQDYNTLLEFTKELNETLHSYKILESQRSLLISCILIALENKAFKASYPLFGSTNEKDTPEEKKKKVENASKELANNLVDTVSNELKNANIKGDRLDNLNIQFSFIKTDTSLSTKKEVLKNLIAEIDKNINSFIKTHEYFDVLGQLYVEFLRYANSDKGLGIVLTPPHITELFSDLAQVNKNSIAYDNCTGTGGFLISAMKKMIADAKGDQTKIKEIKKNHLFGIEYQSHIFALAVSNMYIHQDGKTNIINGNCFDENIMSEIKAIKPTVGFLNPPYKADKKTDTDELEFVLNNLECLVDGGIGVAIVPMQSALAQTGKVYELKKKLLENHTLEAVLSMPNELFFNSNVGVVSCIMIFTAYKSHPANKETYFGYYKDDGFVKRKIQGRIDAFGKWEDIKAKWVSYYLHLNRKQEAGFSINKVVKANDEWCAEVYMETDYSILSNEIFIETLLLYSSYLFLNKISLIVENKSVSNDTVQLKIGEWKYFKLTDLFKITGSKTTPLLELEEYGQGKYPYVTTQATNNGVRGCYDYYSEEGDVLTVDSAVLGYCSYQALPFSASDHVEKLIPKFKMNKYIALFLTTIINLEQYRYNYGIKCSQTRMKKAIIKLPAKNNQIDFELMENYIKSLPYSSSL
ncbi:N-6 DNA methylase [Candidatus Kuenenbacteria bacterium]|nr:N-6 DNA methylase [Candidatus Kuenenbacteria bacterium]